jgi:hypothetical protein
VASGIRSGGAAATTHLRLATHLRKLRARRRDFDLRVVEVHGLRRARDRPHLWPPRPWLRDAGAGEARGTRSARGRGRRRCEVVLIRNRLARSASGALTSNLLGALRADRRGLVLWIGSTLRHPIPVAVAALTPGAAAGQLCIRSRLPHRSMINRQAVIVQAPEGLRLLAALCKRLPSPRCGS